MVLLRHPREERGGGRRGDQSQLYGALVGRVGGEDRFGQEQRRLVGFGEGRSGSGGRGRGRGSGSPGSASPQQLQRGDRRDGAPRTRRSLHLHDAVARVRTRLIVQSGSDRLVRGRRGAAAGRTRRLPGRRRGVRPRCGVRAAARRRLVRVRVCGRRRRRADNRNEH